MATWRLWLDDSKLEPEQFADIDDSYYRLAAQLRCYEPETVDETCGR